MVYSYDFDNIFVLLNLATASQMCVWRLKGGVPMEMQGHLVWNLFSGTTQRRQG